MKHWVDPNVGYVHVAAALMPVSALKVRQKQSDGLPKKWCGGVRESHELPLFRGHPTAHPFDIASASVSPTQCMPNAHQEPPAMTAYLKVSGNNHDSLF
jgi:hypothetical protein